MNLSRYTDQPEICKLNEIVPRVQNKAEYALDLHAPWKEMKLNITERKPFYTNFLLNLRRDLWCLLRKCIQNRTNINRQNYVKLRNKHTYELDRAKKHFVRSKITKDKNDSQESIPDILPPR